MARSALIIEHGRTVTRSITWTDSDGDPINLTGYSVEASITVGDTSYTLTEGSGLTVTPLQGRIALELTDEQTEEFEEQFGTWEVFVTSPSGVEDTLVEGYVFVSM